MTGFVVMTGFTGNTAYMASNGTTRDRDRALTFATVEGARSEARRRQWIRGCYHIQPV